MANILRLNKHILGFTNFVKPSQILRTFSYCGSEAADNCPCPDPCGKWDKNWDKLETSSEKTKMKNCHSKGKDGADVKGTRHLIMIREGDYIQDNDDQILTERGKRQLVSTAKRLASMNIHWNRANIYCTFGVLFDSAKIINDILKIKKHLEEANMLELYSMYSVSADPPLWEPFPPRAIYEGCAITEAMFRFFFHRVEPGPKDDLDSYTVLLGSNLFRSYSICRSLQFPPEAWARFNNVGLGSMSWISIYPNGYVLAKFIGENGYMDPQDVKN